MTEDKKIVDEIINGIREKKGKNIVVADLTSLSEAPCSYFIICEGDSSIHVNTIALSIKDYVREQIKIKPFATDGFENCQWIALDYGQIIVHVFQPAIRAFYDIEHLWEDARMTQLEDII